MGLRCFPTWLGAISLALLLGRESFAAQAAPPDLTQGDTKGVDRKSTYNLGATGLRGWILDDARRRAPCLLADPQRTGTPPVEFPILATFDARTLPDVDSPRKTVVLHSLPRLESPRLR